MENTASLFDSQTPQRSADCKTAVHLCPTENSAVNFRGAELVQAAGGESHKTQRTRIARLLLDARGAWVPLSAILELHIGQYGARIYELRHHLGFLVENRTERDDSGTMHSWYRLVTAPAAKPETVKREVERKDQPGLTGLPLFDLAVSRS